MTEEEPAAAQVQDSQIESAPAVDDPAPVVDAKADIIPASTTAPPIEVQATTAASALNPESNMASLPVRAYLDETVVPLLLRGMLELAKKRSLSFFNLLAVSYLVSQT